MYYTNRKNNTTPSLEHICPTNTLCNGIQQNMAIERMSKNLKLAAAIQVINSSGLSGQDNKNCKENSIAKVICLQ